MEMTMTAEDYKLRTARSYKLILLFAMVSMTMMFAGLTSAYVVSQSRADWLKDFQLPSAFYFSTIAILGCSITFHLAKKAIQKDNHSKTTSLLLATLALGISFVVLQFVGFGQIVADWVLFYWKCKFYYYDIFVCCSCCALDSLGRWDDFIC